MAYRSARSMCKNGLTDVGGRALTSGLFFFLMKSLKRADSMDVPGGGFAISIPSACVAPTSPSALSGEIFSEQSVSALIMALVYGYEPAAMSQLLKASRVMLLQSLSHPYAPSAPCTSISSRYTQHTSRTNTSVSSPSTRTMLLHELAASMR